jgi:hydroxymethylglutaryl-CoA lyase
MALLNVKAALDLGYSRFDAAIGGLGGCPFRARSRRKRGDGRPRLLLQGIGVETGMDAAFRS